MNIRLREVSNTFQQLIKGDTFLISTSPNLYFKLAEKDSGGDNAVDLVTGITYYIQPTYLVNKIKGTFVEDYGN